MRYITRVLVKLFDIELRGRSTVTPLYPSDPLADLRRSDKVPL
jgi:hypothetical protein